MNAWKQEVEHPVYSATHSVLCLEYRFVGKNNNFYWHFACASPSPIPKRKNGKQQPERKPAPLSPIHLAAHRLIFPHATDFKCIIIANVLLLIVKASPPKQFPCNRIWSKRAGGTDMRSSTRKIKLTSHVNGGECWDGTGGRAKNNIAIIIISSPCPRPATWRCGACVYIN